MINKGKELWKWY